MIEVVEAQVKARVGEYIYAVDDENMEEVVAKLLKDNCLTVACAESCTGGMLASRLTSISGSSMYIKGSIVTYSNEAKMKFLDVDKEIFRYKGCSITRSS